MKLKLLLLALLFSNLSFQLLAQENLNDTTQKAKIQFLRKFAHKNCILSKKNTENRLFQYISYTKVLRHECKYFSYC
jgi:ribosomal protein L17